MATSGRWVDSAAGWLCRRTGTGVAVLALLVFAVFTATVLPWQASQGAFYTAAAEAPDTSLWYSADALYRAAEAWGADGRAGYVRARLTFDVVWPLVYGMFLVAGLAWSLARITAGADRDRRPRRLRRSVLLPVLAVALDYAENACTATVVGRYPTRTPLLADLAGVFTTAKWLVLGGCFVLLAVVVLAVLVGRLRSLGRRVGG